jgi:phospholipid/cholesterol/gamma-HCH transport system permease protein
MAPDTSRSESLGQPGGESGGSGAAPLLARALSPATSALEGLGRFMTLTLDTLRWLVLPPFRVGQLMNAMEFIGVQSLFIIMLTGTFSGMVFALQSVNSLREYGAEGVVGSVVAISLTREISPVFSALMITARAGSAIAAELGNMRVTEQIDALTTMAVSPVQYLLSPRLLAGVLMFPLLCIVYSSVGMLGAWIVAVKGLGIDPGVFIANIQEYMQASDFWMGVIKAGCFGFLVTAICGEQGFYASGGARGVGQATTRAVVQSAVALLIANYLITSVLTPI